MLEYIREFFREGVFQKRSKPLNPDEDTSALPLFDAPKVGMYVRSRKSWMMDDYMSASDSDGWVYEEHCPYSLVTDVLIDEGGRFKFQHIGPEKLGWTGWCRIDQFNIRYEVANPWV